MINLFRNSSAALGLTAIALFSAAGSASSAQLAYDGFDYAAGSSLTGKTGPVGFIAAYSAFGAGLNVTSPGLTYTGLTVTGNKLNIAGTNTGVYGGLTNSPETVGSTIYFSYLMQVTSGIGYAGVSLFQGATETLYTGNRNDGFSNFLGIDPKGGTAVNSTSSSANLSLLVYRVDFAASSATIRLYVNPPLSAEPAIASAVVTKTSALTYDRIRIASNGNTGSIDEFRLGQTFADVAGTPPVTQTQEIVVLGSSVAAGTGANPSSQAWAYRFEDLMENHAPVVPGSNTAWQISNASVGGDNTTRVLARYQADVVTAHPGTDCVIIALSLANEGLVGAGNPQAVFDSFKSGLAQIIANCRSNGYYPVISLVYPNGDYSLNEYSYVRKMNVLLNTWNVPSFNFLGAIDDGSGRWPAGYVADSYHPNNAGHGELYYAVVPSLFDAIAAGRTTGPQIQGTNRHLRLQRDAAEPAPIRYTPANPMHSFTMSFRVRSTDVGTVAAVGAGATRSTIEIRDNSLVYIGPTGAEMSTPLDANNGRWYDIALSHRYATGQSLLFVDGILKGTVSDQYVPDLFVLDGAAGASGRALAPQQADFQDLCIYRAAWTQDEAMAQHNGGLQQASLEICAPLADAAPVLGAALENRAQSFSQVTLNTANFTPQLASITPDNLTAASYAVNTASLVWTSHGSAGFTIERRRTGVAEAWSVVGTSPGTAPYYEDNGLLTGVSYDYRVSTQDGGLQSDYTNVASIIPGGQSARSYQQWIADYFTPNTATYLIDFNTNASPAYGTVKWNTVSSLNSATPYTLKDTTNSTAAGYTIAVSDSFDQFRADNGSPLADYPADAQITCFALRDDVPLTGSFTFAHLDPAATYDFTFFARRGALVAGFDYSGTYTFTGNAAPVVVTVNAATNTTLTNVPGIVPNAAGVITLKISTGPGAGTDFPVINFLKMSRVTADTGYIQNIKPTSDPDGDKFPNLEEYARGLNPTQVNSTPLTLTNVGDNAPGTQVHLIVTRDRRAREISYLLEKSADLTSWQVNTQATSSVISRAGSFETLDFSTPGNGTNRFFRIRMVLTPGV
ncbi:MAG: GDSL-type esterase/lipase family protein [Verrucomicrobiota bacterium]